MMKLADKKISTAELIRGYVSKGLDIAAYEENLAQISEVTEAAAYFLLLHEVTTGKGITDGTLDIVEACNKLAVGYIKQQNSNSTNYLYINFPNN